MMAVAVVSDVPAWEVLSEVEEVRHEERGDS